MFTWHQTKQLEIVKCFIWWLITAVHILALKWTCMGYFFLLTCFQWFSAIQSNIKFLTSWSWDVLECFACGTLTFAEETVQLSYCWCLWNLPAESSQASQTVVGCLRTGVKTTLSVSGRQSLLFSFFLSTMITSENIHINIELGSLFKYLDDYINKSLFEWEMVMYNSWVAVGF